MKGNLFLKKIVEDNTDKPNFYVRNLLREYLQVLIISYIYSSKKYKKLFFYGGTCLAHCYNLPRLSEDLDFVDIKKEIDLNELAKDVVVFLSKEANISPISKVQKFRIYFKFPILEELGLAKEKVESNYLFVKVEVFSDFNFCLNFKEEFKPIFKFNQSVLVKTFDLETLMATKIRAVLYRKWEKTTKSGKTLIEVKGRDFFDLMWLIKNNIEPNLSCIEGVKSKKELKEVLLKIVDSADKRSIALDLKNFLADDDFALDIGENIKKILRDELERW